MLGKCQSCETEVDLTAEKCPSCGRQNPTVSDAGQLVIGVAMVGAFVVWLKFFGGFEVIQHLAGLLS
jgi:hypothetical protein